MPSTEPHNLLPSARRESLVALSAWLLALAYSVGYCYWYGYDRSPENLKFVFGIPSWTFWGIVVPWVACFLFSIWFAFGYMQDSPLEGDDTSPEEGGGA